MEVVGERKQEKNNRRDCWILDEMIIRFGFVQCGLFEPSREFG